MSDKIKIGNLIFDTLVAITEKDHSIGLMWKKTAQIMSFPYDKPNIHKFWMQNTYIALDILFCYSGKIVDIQKGIPHSVDLLGPDDLTDLVIELPQGTVNKYNIAIGNNVDLKYSLSTLGKKYAEKLNI